MRPAIAELSVDKASEALDKLQSEWELAGVPLFKAEHRDYLERLKETPRHGFVPPEFGIVHGWRTFFYSLYLRIQVSM